MSDVFHNRSVIVYYPFISTPFFLTLINISYLEFVSPHYFNIQFEVFYCGSFFIFCFMASIQEEFSALQLSIISAQTELDKLDRPETTVEELREYENVLRGIMERLKKITAKVKADRSTNKQVWER